LSYSRALSKQNVFQKTISLRDTYINTFHPNYILVALPDQDIKTKWW